MSRVLIVGNAYDSKWTLQLVNKIKNDEPTIVFDAICSVNEIQDNNLKDVYENVFWVEKQFPSVLYKIPRIRTWCINSDLRCTMLKALTQLENNKITYDVVNIQYLSDILLSYVDKYRNIGTRLVLTPWGSDVLRASKKKLEVMSSYVNNYDLITDTDSDKFRQEIKQKLGVDEKKFLNIDFGSDLVDYIIKNGNISSDAAKCALGLSGRYVITCGYNGADGQNHIRIIESLSAVKDKLPKNTTLLLPMGYGVRANYLIKVEDKLRQSGFRYVIVKEYLHGEKLFCLRKCTDVFIHAQRTDANSSSLAEYILCGSTILNASWLSGNMQADIKFPYYTFKDFADLSQKVIEAISKGSRVDLLWKEKMHKFGWDYRISQWINLYNS